MVLPLYCRYAEFQATLKTSWLPRNTKMVVLCSRPSFEFRAFQVGLTGLTKQGEAD